jgi:hypothetical protein
MFGVRQTKRRKSMSEAKIDIKIGQIQFSGQGEQEWVAKQLDKIIAQAEKLIQLAPLQVPPGDGGGDRKHMEKDFTISRKTLPVFLSEKGATKNQVKKFLATAVWLEAKGQNRLQTRDVVAALKTANQSRLGNASDALKKNITKGFCEKDGTQFFVTDEGKKSL